MRKDESPSANATGAGEEISGATKQDDDGSKVDSKPVTVRLETEGGGGDGGGTVEVPMDVHEGGVATDTARTPGGAENEEEGKVEREAGSQ